MHPTWTLIIVVVLAALLFMRPGKLSGFMEDLGKGIKGFKKGMADDQNPQPPVDPNRQVSDQSNSSNTTQQRDRVDH